MAGGAYSAAHIEMRWDFFGGGSEGGGGIPEDLKEMSRRSPMGGIDRYPHALDRRCDETACQLEYGPGGSKGVSRGTRGGWGILRRRYPPGIPGRGWAPSDRYWRRPLTSTLSAEITRAKGARQLGERATMSPVFGEACRPRPRCIRPMRPTGFLLSAAEAPSTPLVPGDTAPRESFKQTLGTKNTKRRFIKAPGVNDRYCMRGLLPRRSPSSGIIPRGG